MLRLACDDAEIVIAPAIGGGIAALRFAGIDALRPASAQALAMGDPLGLGEFPMAPFVNRLAGNGFSWQGQAIKLAPAQPGGHEALHGSAWHQPWQIVEAGPDWALLETQITPGPAWPFACTIQRRVQLTARALRLVMTIRAEGAQPMPAALGFHPYFPAAGALIRAHTQSAWVADARGIPASHQEIAACALLRGAGGPSALALDHCFTGWDGLARLTWPSHELTLRATPNPGFLQIYTPQGADYFCIEPQTAMPDAFNRPASQSGARSLAQGEELDLTLEIAFSAR